MSGQIDVKKLWEAVNATLHEGAINRPLWEAARTAVPLLVEAETATLILGMPTARMDLAGHLETRVNKARLQEIVQAKLGRRLDLRIIEGETAEAYHRAAERERMRAASAEAAHAKAQGVQTAAASWDALNEQILMSHTQTEGRRFVTTRARFLIRCVRMTADAEDRIREREPNKEDFHQRQLDRTLEKVATLTDTPVSIVALEYLRYRSSMQKRRS
ncbi:MAG: hypothetical protein FJX74_14070 [Armatimonadetes bacterium]|nr:hypothetical protein [Armatimonadota bacterium]